MDAIENFEAKKKPVAPHVSHFNPTFDSAERELREQIADLKDLILKNVTNALVYFLEWML